MDYIVTIKSTYGACMCWALPSDGIACSLYHGFKEKTLELRLILHELPLCTQTRFSILAIAPCVPRQRKAEYTAEINIAAEKAARDKLGSQQK